MSDLPVPVIRRSDSDRDTWKRSRVNPPIRSEADENEPRPARTDDVASVCAACWAY